MARKCATCHGDKGQGTLAAPPLWGKASFNDGAGMAKLDNFAAFAHLNMPFGNPDMSIEEALDVAVFITTGPRPHFTEKTKPVSQEMEFPLHSPFRCSVVAGK